MEILETFAAKRRFVRIRDPESWWPMAPVEHQDALAGSREQGGSLFVKRARSSDQALSVTPLGECPANG